MSMETSGRPGAAVIWNRRRISHRLGPSLSCPHLELIASPVSLSLAFRFLLHPLSKITMISPKTILATLIHFSPLVAVSLATRPAEAEDLPVNANFDDGTSPFWDHASEGNTQIIEVTADGQLCSTIEATTNLDEAGVSAKVNPWDHILGLSDIALTSEQYYRVTFTATFTPATAPADPAATREIRFKTGLGEDPYTDYYLTKTQLTATPQVVDITFRNLREDPTAQAQFQIGGTPGMVCIDNFVLEAVAPPAPVVYTTTSPTGYGLKDYSAFVKIGTAVDTPIFLSSPPHNAVAAAEFGAITPANAMKMNIIQPVRGMFDFTDADALYAYALQNGMEFRGHPLVWHTQASSFLGEEGVDRDTTLQIMYEHIDGVMAHFPNLPYWDVVNEAIDRNEAGEWTFRSTPWHDMIGPDFIDLAFTRARAIDPDTKLLYNDYNIEQMGNPKADKVFEMVQDMKLRGIPIDAVGLQSHYYVEPDGSTENGVPDMQAIRENMARYEAIGVDVHITECDFRIGKPMDATKEQLQNQFYADLLQACIDAPNCSHFTVWGLSDIDSWVPSTFPEYDFAHIFDAQFAAKPAYYAMTGVLAHYNLDGTLIGGGPDGGTTSGDAGGDSGGCSVSSTTQNASWPALLCSLVGLLLWSRRSSRFGGRRPLFASAGQRHE